MLRQLLGVLPDGALVGAPAGALIVGSEHQQKAR